MNRKTPARSLRCLRPVAAGLALALLPVLVSCYGPGGSGVSGLASLAPTIQAQPQSLTVPLGGTATFQVTGGGSQLPSFQWQRSNDGGATWAALAGATGSSYGISPAAASDNQAQFRVVLAAPGGTTTSAVATLTVTGGTGTSQQVVSLAPGSVPLGICVGPDGNLWFTNSGKGQIGKLDTLTHQVVLAALPDPGSRPVGIAAGPDGNLWFTEQAAGKVGVITPAGTVKGEFPVGQGPTGITAGSDGNLWFTLQTANMIGRMTTTGLVALYPVPTPAAAPTGITLAPDGSVWFSEQASAKIGRITPAGAILEWAALPPAGGVQPTPQGITATADGAIWYADPANDCIAKFAAATQTQVPAGRKAVRARRALADHLSVVDFFPLGNGAGPAGLTPDDKGNVWVAEQGFGKLAVLTPASAAGSTPPSYALPTATGHPSGIAQGPDGNLWVTEPVADDLVVMVDSALPSAIAVAALARSTTLYGGETTLVRATVLGLPDTAVTWSIQEGAAGGTIDPALGIYTAPMQAGLYHVVATTRTVPPIVATTAVTVVIPSITTVTPSAPGTTEGGAISFSALVSGLPDDSIVWSASAGSIDPVTGAWTAPVSVGTVTITATSSLDPNLTATYQVVIAPSAPVILTQPGNSTVALGAMASFSVVAGGVPAPTSYQWQESADGLTWVTIPGGNLATWTTPPATAGDNGTQFRVLVGNGVGTTASLAALLTITPQAPSFTTQPAGTTVAGGATATFRAAAIGEPAPTYQWQVSTDGGNSWQAIAGATGASWTTPATGPGDDGSLFTVVASNSKGTATSDTAHLAVTYAPVIVSQPVSQGVGLGAPVSFFVVAKGDPPPAYQWQSSSDGGGTWGNVASGGTAATYQIAATASADNGKLFRVVVTNGVGAGDTSAAASLPLGSQALSILTQPGSATVAAPAPASFTVVAAGQPAPSFQWQVSKDGGVTWNNAGSGTGAQAATYTTAATGAADDGSLYQVQVFNSTGATTSSAAHLTVDYAPVVVTPPANQIVNLGSIAVFAVVAKADPAPTSYQWQVSTDGGTTWNPPANGSGAATPTFTTAPAGYGDAGSRFRVVITNAQGSATSASASLALSPLAPIITTQPTNQTVTAGGTATFTALATGEPAPTYQWQVLAKGAGNWQPITGATGPSYSAPVASGDDGSLYQVVAFNSNGTATSSSAALTVQFLTVTAPSPQTVLATATASFSVQAAGDPAPSTWQWQVSLDGGATWNNVGAGTGGTTAAYTTPAATPLLDGSLYRAQVGNGVGSVTSGSASLTVQYLAVGAVAPATQTVVAPGPATFTVAVAGDPAPTGYQWQVSTDGGSTWNDIASGGNGASYTLPATTSANDGNQFRAVVSSVLGSAPSLAAGVLAVTYPPIVTVTDPDLQVAPGMSTTFSAAVQSNPPATSFQWQLSPDGGATWNNSGTASPANTPLTLDGLTSNPQVRLIVGNGLASTTSAAVTVKVLPPYPDTWMAAGNNHNLLIHAGAVLAAGRNDLGQLGDGDLLHSNSYQPVTYQGVAPAALGQVDAAGEHSLALDSSGTVWWWGANLTNPAVKVANAQPVPLFVIATPPAPAALAGNSGASFILMKDGSVQSYVPGAGAASPVAGLTGLTVTAITAGDVDANGRSYLVALDKTGAIWGLEPNFYGIYVRGPQQGAPPSGSPVVALYAGRDANLYALDAQGALWEWPNLDPTTASTPVAVAFPSATAPGKCVALAKGGAFLLGLGSDGNLWASGDNSYGQLGQNNNNVGTYTGFVQVPMTASVQSVAAGTAFAMAMDSTGTAWAWGFQGFGELANYSSAVDSWTMVGWESPSNPPWPRPVASSADVIVFGNNPPLFWIWGSDPDLFLNSTVSTQGLPQNGPTGIPAYSQVYTSSLARFALALDTAGGLWGWGDNTSGQLGTGTLGPLPAPGYGKVALPKGATVVQAAIGAGHGLALDLQGNLWGWGDNTSGQLGDGNVVANMVKQPTPYKPAIGNPLGTGEAWIGFACGTSHSVGLTNQGDVFTWGSNQNGQIGTGSIDENAHQPYLALTGGSYPMIQVSAGALHTVALDGGGNVYTWGGNAFGQLGNGGTADNGNPNMVLTLNMGGPGTAQVLAGPTFTLAMDTNGAIWGWGDNSLGVLPGLTSGASTDSTVITSPQQLYPYATFGFLAATASSGLATDTNGNLWTWGYDQGGMLGLGPNYFNPTPGQVTLP